MGAAWTDLPDEGLIKRVLAQAGEGKADFVEVFSQAIAFRTFRLEGSRVEEAASGREVGAGVRVVRGRSQSYAYTSSLTSEALLEAARAARAHLPPSGGKEIRFHEVAAGNLARVRVPPEEVPIEARLDYLFRADQHARSMDPRIRQVRVEVAESHSEVLVASSLGVLAREERTRVRVAASVVAAADGVVQTGHESVGLLGGLELLEDEPPEKVVERAARRAVAMLEARPAPAGEMTVVLSGEGAGVFFHEAVGHGLEADLVEKGASVYARLRGKKVGSELLTGVDDGGLPGVWGSFAFDDEGTPAARTVLIHEGVVSELLTDRVRSMALGEPLSGNGRRESYLHIPIPRMSNTFILPGKDDPEEILASTEKGLYVAAIGGGEVNPATGEFVFGVTEGYMILGGNSPTL